MKGRFPKLGLLCVALFLSFVAVKPAKAFYIEMPQVLKDLMTVLSSNKSLAQEGNQVMTGPTCNVNGVEMPGTCDQYNNQMPSQPGSNMGMGPGQQNMGPNQNMGPGPGQQNMGPSPEQQARQLADWKRNIQQMERPIKEFQKMLDKAVKSGVVVPDEIKQTMEKLNSLLASMKAVTTMEEMQNVDMSEMGDLMQTLEEYRRNVVEASQRMQDMKRNVKNMESGLKMFEKQVANFTKKKIVIPADVQENIAKLRTIIDAIKNAKTWDEIEQLDLESMGDLMNSLQEGRQQMEMLARWPQTLKQINSELTRLDRQLKKDKAIVDRLLKKEMDLQGVYASFQEAINKLKAVRDGAVANIAAGNSQDAFDAVENDFFSQMEDVWQNDRVIQMMANLGRFNSEFKRGMNQAQLTIKQLKRQKLDTSELESILAETKTKGQEMLNLIKSKEIDEDSIIFGMDELENLRQEFEEKVAELTGSSEIMPWEQGPSQFKSIEMPKVIQQYIQSQPTQATPAPPQPVPAQPTIAP